MALIDILTDPGESATFILPPGQVFTPLYSEGTGYTRPQGVIVSDAGNSATSFKTDRSETTTDHWKDALVLFITGSLIHQTKKVSAYNGTTKVLTMSGAFTGTPSVGDKFVLINF